MVENSIIKARHRWMLLSPTNELNNYEFTSNVHVMCQAAPSPSTATCAYRAGGTRAYHPPTLSSWHYVITRLPPGCPTTHKKVVDNILFSLATQTRWSWARQSTTWFSGYLSAIVTEASIHLAEMAKTAKPKKNPLGKYELP